jgi:hypothetical protein
MAECEESVGEARFVYANACESPVRKSRSVGTEVEFLLEVFILSLEMLGHEEHALGPDDFLRFCHTTVSDRRGCLFRFVQYFQDLRLERIGDVGSLIVVDHFFESGAARQSSCRQ